MIFANAIWHFILSSEEFQRQMHVICKDLPGVMVIADDILVYGCCSTEEEYRQDHNANLKQLEQGMQY